MSNHKFAIPDATLNQLGEFSGGGYILFIYDQNSAPKIYADFDTQAHGLGMQKYIQNWINIVDALSVENTIEEINNPEDTSTGGDSSEDDSAENT